MTDVGRRAPGDGPDVILVAVDDSTTGLRAGAYAAGLARRQGSRLVVVHVLPLATPAVTPMAPIIIGAEMAATLDEIAARLGREVLRQADRLGVNAEYVLAYGDPAKEIAVVADRRYADAVIVGASLKAGHRLVGSVAVRLVRRGRWPVTVVP